MKLATLLTLIAAPLLAADAPSFRNHVQPILAKTGCSSGACHGAAAGQGGFRLSLRGYDDEGDFLALTRGAFGRRVNLPEPGKSLILLKATSAVAHKGGERFPVDSPEWRTLADWVANGAPGPKAEDARIASLHVEPANATLAPGAKQQFRVQAKFSDGTTQDVTRWAKFTAANQSVLTVDDHGLATVVGNGESAVSVWYLQKVALGSASVPFGNEVDPAIYAQAPRRNWIDDLVLEKLRELRLPPSPRSADGEFVRRAFLDTIGVLPTAAETRKFVADPAVDKRDRLIDALLGRPEFVDYWTYKWSDLLLVTKRKLPLAAMWSYYRWIRDQVASNTPWDEFTRRILTAQGSTLENGAGNYFVITPDPRDLSEKTAVTFLGISTNCAKCHNHPMEKWTNNDYYAYANLFARVRMKNGEGEGDKIIFAASGGDLVQPLTGKPQAPRPLGVLETPPDDAPDRRTALAAWLTSPENPYFARAITNRVWANYFGVGLVEAVDDIRETNPASNEKLLTATAQWLVKNGYDLRALMREILQSETYQRSSQPLPGNKADTRFYSRYYPRRLMAEVLHDAIAQATEVPTVFKTRNPFDAGDRQDAFPSGWRALQLPDANTDSYFTRTFGRPLRELTCECERTAEPSVTQALHLANGETLNAKLRDPKSRVGKAISSKQSLEAWLEDTYLAAFSRLPTPAETEVIRESIAEGKTETQAAMEDTVWALLSSREFLFNH
jgi:hypothetical protein